MEGDIEKGIINFRGQGKKDGKISFTISIALQVDMAIVPEKILNKQNHGMRFLTIL